MKLPSLRHDSAGLPIETFFLQDFEIKNSFIFATFLTIIYSLVSAQNCYTTGSQCPARMPCAY